MNNVFLAFNLLWWRTHCDQFMFYYSWKIYKHDVVSNSKACWLGVMKFYNGSINSRKIYVQYEKNIDSND